ncbi:MAG: GNAT family N-acetyltransferase [Chitinophagales bacterium]
MIRFRELSENEIHKIREIDREEEIFEFYEYDKGSLKLESRRITVLQFDPLELGKMIQNQIRLKSKGGKITGAFDKEQLIGVASVERKKRGSQLNYCKMYILYVSKDYRGMRIGQKLLEESKKTGKEFGADKLYISATPTKNTIDFYLSNGAILTTELDKELYDLEPEDIHLELDVEKQ